MAMKGVNTKSWSNERPILMRVTRRGLDPIGVIESMHG